jgi:hypothetical protein
MNAPRPLGPPLPPNLQDIAEDLRRAAHGVARWHRRRRRAILAATGLAAALVFVAAGLATGLIGGPAPENVKGSLAALDAGMPAALRLDPDIEGAHSVATDGQSTLYVASLRDGGECLVIVTTDGREHGAPCDTATGADQRPIDVSLPADGGGGPAAPVVLGGHVNLPAVSRLELRYEDGLAEEIPLAPDGYFVYDLPEARRPAAHGHSLSLVAIDAGGREIARGEIPADWDGPAQLGSGPIREALIRSDERDFTLALGVDGIVDPGRVATLEIVWPDATRDEIPVEPDGSFGYAFPVTRAHELAHDAATLVARDANGHVVARQQITSVANARAGG